MPGLVLYQAGLNFITGFEAFMAAGVETAAGWGFEGRWDVSAENDSLAAFLDRGIGDRDGGEKGLGVRMLRLSE